MPRSEIQAEIVQAAAGFHGLILKIIFPSSYLIFDNPIAFDSSDGVLNADTQAGDLAVVLFLLRGKFFAPRLFHGLDHGHARQRKTLKASVLAQAAPFRQDQVGFICYFLVVLLAFAGWCKQEYLGLSIDQHIVLDAMPFFLATIEEALDFLVFGSLDGSFRAIVEEQLPFFRRQMQLRDIPGRLFAQSCQRLVQARMQDMNPLICDWLRHFEDFSKNVLSGRFAQIHQDKHKFVFHRWQRTITILHVATLAALFLFQCVELHPLQKADAKGRQQRLKFFQGVPGQSKKLYLFPRKSGIMGHGGAPS